MKKILFQIMLLLCAAYSFAGEWQWNVVVKGMVSSETDRNPEAFLWLPPKADRIKAVVVGQHNMSEETLFEMDSFRQKLAEMGVGMIWITPGLDQQWKVETGVQKAFALPPGLAIFTVSEAAFERAATVKGRGYYFDFLEFKKNGDKNMTPSTPVINHIYALDSKLNEIFAEGLEARFARHQKLAEMTRAWALNHGFILYPEEGYESVTLTCINNGAKPGGRVIDVEKFVKLVKEQGFLINGGYGKIKGTTFRISNMGDETPETMNELFAAMDKAIAQL